MVVVLVTEPLVPHDLIDYDEDDEPECSLKAAPNLEWCIGTMNQHGKVGRVENVANLLPRQSKVLPLLMEGSTFVR